MDKSQRQGSGGHGIYIAAGALLFLAAALMLLPAPASAWTGGPDGCGYTGIDSASPGGPAYNFVDISTTGTGLSHSDDSAINVVIPFTFTFCGVGYTTIRTSSNGYVCFGTPSVSCTQYAYSGSASPPTASTPNPAAFGYFTDLYPPGCTGGASACAKWQVMGAPGNQVFIYMQKDTPYCCSSSPQPVTYEIKLFEADDCIEVHYLSASDPGASRHTIGGIQESPTSALVYFDTTPGTSKTATAVRYCQTTTPPPTCSPATQTGGPGAFNFNAINGVPPLSWSAPAGTPTTGAGSAFSTSFGGAGTYTVTVTDSVGNFSNCTVNVVLPGCGYTVNTSATYNFVDLTGIGTGVSLSDDSYAQVTPSPTFTFPFCGTNYSTFRLSSNGYLCFGSPSCSTYAYSGSPSLPSTSGNPPRPAVFGYFTDLYPPGCSGGSTACARWDLQGPPGNRVFMYMQKQTPYCCSSSPQPVTYEIKLFEATGCFEVHFQSVSDPSSHHTISGYQNAAGSSSYTYADTTPGFLRTAQAWSACPFNPAGADAFTIDEDDPAANFDVLANDAAGATVVSVSGGTLGTPTVGPGGLSVTYVPSLDANGVDTFTYTNSAGGTGTVTMTVVPVNDAPAFLAPASAVEAAQGTPAQVYPGWAVGVVPGPTTALDEASQSITFPGLLGSNSNPAIFAIQPTLDRTVSAASTTPSSGTGDFAMLSFTPSATTYGTATVCFVAQDSGGTANGGVDQSVPSCVDITVNPCSVQDDSYIAYRWWTLDVLQPGVTGNDAANPIYPVTVVAPTTNGQLTLDDATGGFSYYADETYLGLDQFQYTVRCGNADSGVATATIDVRVNQPPVAYFEDNADAVSPGQAVSFNPCPAAPPSCSYDPDGEIVAYLWEFGDGYTSFLASPGHVFDAPGTYRVQLTVRDNVGNTSTYVRTIEVEWPGAGPVADQGGGAMAPMADAGGNRTVLEGTRLVLEGLQQGGSEWVTWQWTQVAGPAVTLANATTPFLSLTAPLLPDGRAVDLIFALRVAEGSLTSRASYAVIHVASANHPPLAHAGGMVTFAPGDVVTLDGSQSMDPDGDPLTFQWEQILSIGAIVVDLQGAGTATATFTAPDAAGFLQFRLRVSDGKAASQDAATVVLQAAPQAAPAFTFELTRVGEGAEVTFTAVHGLQDVSWDFGDGERATGVTARHLFAAGEHVVTMTAGQGESAQSHSRLVEVNPVAAAARPTATESGPWMPALLVGAVALASLVVGAVWFRRRTA